MGKRNSKALSGIFGIAAAVGMAALAPGPRKQL